MNSMRHIFQRWLLVFVLIAFALTFCVSFFVQTRQAEQNAIELIGIKINDAQEQIDQNDKNLASIRMLNDETALAKARVFARLVAEDPELLTDDTKLEAVRLELQVDELHISNEEGILIQSIPKEYEGYDMASAPQSAAFLPAITYPNFSLVQSPQPKGIDNEMFQYVGVCRTDSPGIIQIGMKPQRLAEAMEIASIENLAPGFRIGSSGSIIVCQEEEIVSIADKAFVGASIGDYGIDPALLNGESFNVTLKGTDYIGDSREYRDYTIIGILPQAEMYTSRNAMAVFLVLCNLVLFAVVFALVSLLVQKVVINGILQINASLKKITEGDLDCVVKVTDNEEFRSLSSGINATVGALKNAIAAEAARIDKELEFARQIQHSSLPSVFPPYPERQEFGLWAQMDTAKEVGGDFYDFFLKGNQLSFLVADVSGKGIPAALFMMRAKTFLQSKALSGASPEETMEAANGHLCADNEAGMFVTAWFGQLDLSSGLLTYVNAGHNPPLLKRGEGGFAYLKGRSGFILAGMEGIRYKASQLTLAPGDQLFLYTDGVTEATNPQGELYGEERLKVCLDRLAAAPLGEVLPAVKADVDRFAAGADQFDDITMLLLRFYGAKGENNENDYHSGRG